MHGNTTNNRAAFFRIQIMAKIVRIQRDAGAAQAGERRVLRNRLESRFVEVTGLDERNVSSASDIARLLRASADNPTIRKITTTQRYDFRSDYRNVPRAHTIGNTNRLLYNRRMEIVGGKTGFINEAGYCFATWIRTEGRDMIAVVLGAPTNATRFADVVRLVQRTVSQSIAPAPKS